MSLWLPLDGPVRVRRNVAPVTGGTHVAGARIKLLSHTTEGGRFTPHPRLYHGHTGWPHITNDVDGTLWQHIDLDIAARALKNAPGGVQTNRGGPVQVENVGFSPLDHTMTLTPAQVESFRWLALFLHQHRGLELTAAAPWPTVGSARASAPQRIAARDWYQTGGIIAHALAPENDHWDSGGIPLAELLPTIPTASEEDPDMPFLAQAVSGGKRTGPVYLITGDRAIGVPDRPRLSAAQQLHGDHPKAAKDGIVEVDPAYLQLYGIA